MTTATAPTTSKTVPVQDVQLFSLGQRTDEAGPLAAVPGLGNVVATFVIAGSSSTQQLSLTITGLHLTTATPAVVLLQPRQSANQDFGFPDEFAVQVSTHPRPSFWSGSDGSTAIPDGDRNCAWTSSSLTL